MLLPETGFASWWVSDQKKQPSQRIGKGRVLLTISKAEGWDYFPKQCFLEQWNWGDFKLRVHAYSWRGLHNEELRMELGQKSSYRARVQAIVDGSQEDQQRSVSLILWLQLVWCLCAPRGLNPAKKTQEWSVCQVNLCFWNSSEVFLKNYFIYLFMRDTEGEAETQAEGEADRVWCGTRSQNPRIMTWAKVRCSITEPPRLPREWFIYFVLLLGCWQAEARIKVAQSYLGYIFQRFYT